MKYLLAGQDIAPDLSAFNVLDIYHIEDSVNPIYIRQKSMDFMIMNEVFGHECYDAEMEKSPHYHDYRRRFGVRIPQNIIDVGAHTGLASIYYALRYPKAKIVAIEPEKDNYRLLLKNTAAYPNILPFNGAIANEKTELYISAKASYGRNQYLKSADYAWTEAASNFADQITACSIEDIMNKYGMDQIDLLKIDAEGSERTIFEKNYEQWLPKVRILVFEQHDFKLQGCSRSVFKALCNYNFYYMYDNSDLPNVMMFLIDG